MQNAAEEVNYTTKAKFRLNDCFFLYYYHSDVCDRLIQTQKTFCNNYKRITKKNCGAYTQLLTNDKPLRFSRIINVLDNQHFYKSRQQYLYKY